MDQSQMGPACKCPHHKMVPIFIILLGLLFLLNALSVISWYVTSIVWPIILIVIGLQKIFQRNCKCCSRP